MAYQIISLAGAVMILSAYAAMQLGRLAAETRTYQFLNLAGGACLCVAAVAAKQLGFILLEGSWAVASAYGLWRVIRRTAKD